MTAPKDTDDVLAALKLGWAVAEIRGRYRLDAPDPSRDAMPPTSGTALPLRSERSAEDQRREAKKLLTGVLATLTQQLKTLDTDPDNASKPFSTVIASEAAVLDAIPDKTSSDAQTAWDNFGRLLHRFDAHVQDALMAVSDQQACGYLLGRGLAETYWALDPSPKLMPPAGQKPTDARSWAFLLGEPRCKELTRLLGRLLAYFNSYTTPAISGSLVVWQKVVTTPGWWEQTTARDELYQQMRRWYGLLLVGQDPTTLVKPFALLRNLRTTWNAIRLFLPQLLFGALSIAALFGLVAAAGTPLGKTFGVVVGAVGVSLTSLVAKAKSSAQALTTRIREDAYADLVTVAITVVPPRTDRDKRGVRGAIRRSMYSPTRRSVTAALRDRTLTTPVNV